MAGCKPHYGNATRVMMIESNRPPYCPFQKPSLQKPRQNVSSFNYTLLGCSAVVCVKEGSSRTAIPAKTPAARARPRGVPCVAASHVKRHLPRQHHNMTEQLNLRSCIGLCLGHGAVVAGACTAAQAAALISSMLRWCASCTLRSQALAAACTTGSCSHLMGRP